MKIVGQDPGQDKLPIKAFTIPRDLLRWYSSYYVAALDPESDFCVGGDEALTLTERIEIFEVFVCWMYTGRLQDPQTSLGDAATASPYLPAQLLCEIWVFVDMRGVPALGDAAIDMFHERITAT